MYGAFEPNNPYTYSFVQEVDLVILPFTISLARSRVMKHVGFIGGDIDVFLNKYPEPQISWKAASQPFTVEVSLNSRFNDLSFNSLRNQGMAWLAAFIDFHYNNQHGHRSNTLEIRRTRSAVKGTQ